MGITTCLMFAALTFGGSPSTGPEVSGGAPARPSPRFLQLDPGATVLEGPLGLHLEFPLAEASIDAPLEVAVTGIAHGFGVHELARERFTQAGEAFAFVRHRELATWDLVVVTWTRSAAGSGPPGSRVPAADGSARAGDASRSEGGFLAHIEAATGRGRARAGLVPGTVVAQQSEPEVNGNFFTYHCPEEGGDCVVSYYFFSPKNGKLTEATEDLEPGGSFTMSAFLVVAHSCEGCA